MCLVSSRPRWEDDVTSAPRPAGYRNARKHVTETTTTRRRSRQPSPPVIYVPPPRPRTPTPPPPVTILPAPIIRPVTPPSPPRVELVSVEEDSYRRSPRASRASVSSAGRKSRRRSGGEEVYIERERERVRIPQPPPQPEYETYRYVNGPERVITEPEERRTRRVVERERLVERERDGGRREYYR